MVGDAADAMRLFTLAEKLCFLKVDQESEEEVEEPDQVACFSQDAQGRFAVAAVALLETFENIEKQFRRAHKMGGNTVPSAVSSSSPAFRAPLC